MHKAWTRSWGAPLLVESLWYNPDPYHPLRALVTPAVPPLAAVLMRRDQYFMRCPNCPNCQVMPANGSIIVLTLNFIYQDFHITWVHVGFHRWILTFTSRYMIHDVCSDIETLHTYTQTASEPHKILFFSQSVTLSGNTNHYILGHLLKPGQ